MSGPGGIFGIVGVISRFMNVPIGASVRKHGENSNKKSDKMLAQHELIKSVLEITVDDVCLGNSPFFYTNDGNLSRETKKKLDNLNSELNSIAKWAAHDLLAVGFSVYTISVLKGKLFILPEIDEVEFFLTSKKRVVVFKEGVELKGALAFLNFRKTSLTKVEKDKEKQESGEEDLLYKIDPVPCQLDNVENTVKELQLIERAIQRYRRDARIIRFATVDVGYSQGDNITTTTDMVANGLNADPISLEEATLSEYFNDEIPVFPTRGEKGKPEIHDNKMEFNVSEMMDLDHVLSKLFLGMRFPKTYADFSTALDATAVSMIRSDVRYSRLIKQVRSLMVDRVNSFTASVDLIKNQNVKFKLTEMPTPEEEEVVASLTLYGDFTKDMYEFVITESETAEAAKSKLSMLESLLGNSTSMPSVQRWLEVVRGAIRERFKEGGPRKEEIPMGEESTQDISTEEIPVEEVPPEEG